MNFFKKIWNAVAELLPNRITDEKVVSTVEKVWEKSEESSEVVEIIRSIDNKESKTRIIATINQIDREIKTLEEKKEKINERLTKISEVETPNNSLEINESLAKIKQLIETKITQTNSRFFHTDSQKFDNFLKNNNLLKQFKEREEARKRKEELHKKQIHSKLDSISIFISQDKLDEAKLLIAQIQKQIKNSYKHELDRLNKAQQKLKEKELQILKKQQEEAQRKRDEEAKRIKEIEEKRKEDERKRREWQEKEEKERQEKLREKLTIENRIREEKQREESRKQREQEERERQAKAELEKLLVKKHNWQEFQQVLQQNGITTLYHFTDRANIKSIKEHRGLYSWHYCDRNNIDVLYSGGDTLSRQLDMQHNLQDFVRLSFCNDHPMMWRLKQNGRNLVLLQVNIDVSYFEKTCFSDINATDGDHTHGSDLQDLRRIDFKATKRNYVRREDSDFKPHQAEVLVKTWIPIEYITNINNF